MVPKTLKLIVFGALLTYPAKVVYLDYTRQFASRASQMYRQPTIMCSPE